MRSASSPAALRVKVRPSTSAGFTWPLATSHSTRLAIVSVLPDPAPATTSAGARAAPRSRPLLRASGAQDLVPRDSASASAMSIRGVALSHASPPAPAAAPLRIGRRPDTPSARAGRETRRGHPLGRARRPLRGRPRVRRRRGWPGSPRGSACPAIPLLTRQQLRAARPVLAVRFEERVEHAPRGRRAGRCRAARWSSILARWSARPVLRSTICTSPRGGELDPVDRSRSPPRVAEREAEAALRGDEDLPAAAKSPR